MSQGELSQGQTNQGSASDRAFSIMDNPDSLVQQPQLEHDQRSIAEQLHQLECSLSGVAGMGDNARLSIEEQFHDLERPVSADKSTSKHSLSADQWDGSMSPVDDITRPVLPKGITSSAVESTEPELSRSVRSRTLLNKYIS